MFSLTALSLSLPVPPPSLSLQNDLIEKFKCVKKKYSVRDIFSWIPKMLYHCVGVAKHKMSQATYAFLEVAELLNDGWKRKEEKKKKKKKKKKKRRRRIRGVGI